MKFGVVAAVIVVFMLLVGMWACNMVFNYGSKAAAVVSHEIDPQVLQNKYEWFKDTYAQLEADKANISTLESRMKIVEKMPNPDRTDREQLMTWQQEVAGVKAAYNDLAAEYNSEMSKWNYRFTNIGDLPNGASQPLPRNVAPYVEE